MHFCGNSFHLIKALPQIWLGTRSKFRPHSPSRHFFADETDLKIVQFTSTKRKISQRFKVSIFCPKNECVFPETGVPFRWVLAG
jgi:hypothetical protein